jgi:hypothetical protein
VDSRAEIREFLTTRRAKITPEQAGLQRGGGQRRVPGLRREEVAVLAGVSTDWYVRLELAINPLGRALYSPVFEDPPRPANLRSGSARSCRRRTGAW